MAQLTTNTGETTLGALLGSDNVYSVPYFQRPYRWQKQRIDQFNRDLIDLVDGVTDAHFLGAVIMHGVDTDPADPNVYEVIDGQQRITTAYLYLCAAVEALIVHGQKDEAHALFKKYLVITGSSGQLSNLALHTGKDDRSALNGIVQGLDASGGFAFALKPLKHSSTNVGPESAVARNYKRIRRFFADQVRQTGPSQIKPIYTQLLQGMRMIQIGVKDPTNGPKIFDSLNSRQEPMTIGDLVRNDIFSRGDVGDPNEIEQIDDEHWRPFYKEFRRGKKDYFDAFFFPYGLVHDPNLQKSDVYGFLRRTWEGQSPKEVIGGLAEYQPHFMDLVTGTRTVRHDPGVSDQINRLFRAGLPSSSYPFLMRLSREVELGHVPVDNGCDLLEGLESFLVRRAVCGIEPTGLHAVFKRLWADLDGEVTSARLQAVISEHKTVSWPTSEEFSSSIRSRALYGAGICRFLLQELDTSTPGDTVTDSFTIEHVLPQTYSDRVPAFLEAWGQFSREGHATIVDTLANLIPVTGPMNSGLGQTPYAQKRASYLLKSKYASARAFGDKYAEWGPAELAQRADELAAWSLSRWPYGG